MSGLKIYEDKTKTIWIGAMKGSNVEFCKEIKRDWQTSNFKILGINPNCNLNNLWGIN